MIVGGNWKCNLTQAKALELVEHLNAMHVGDVEVVVAPVLLHLPQVQSKLKRSIGVAAQNCSFAGMGAYTGDVSAEHLANIDVPWVILGHSERRSHFGEDDALLATKLEHALEAGLRVIFCVGEQKADREAGRTLDVCKAQLEKVAHLLDPARTVIAYEPVWAIGTGLVATPAQAQETHREIRAYLAQAASADVAAKIRIQYGGSVNASNCAELAGLPDVDGFLVGGASLKHADFGTIVGACRGRHEQFGPFMVDAVAYPVLCACIFAPAVVRVHPYAHMLVLATVIVYVGCHRALAQAVATPGEAQTETVTKKEAMQFPLYGSAVLVGLYVVVKFVKKEYLNMLLAVYFFGLGAGAVHQAVRTPLQALPAVQALKTHVWRLRWQFWDKHAEAEKIEFNALDVPLLALGVGVSLAYALTKRWVLANVLAASFSLCAIEMLSLGSFQIGALLLCALFLYDIFWVFGTEVMVTVAKGIDAPIKLLFPKDLHAEKVEFSLLGLGDIVIPGIFVALMLRFDMKQRLHALPYFRANLCAYVGALVATISVMHFFEAAQPALLYLVPGCLGAAGLVAAQRGELGALWAFSDDDAEGSAAEKKKAAAKKSE
mmetsp:Transcript_20197/g.52099  ORF Transcript_20197/g.52099 Transcript_20197/m.52099 type:complete len:604 (+) Transcript_20197:3-1814(+)